MLRALSSTIRIFAKLPPPRMRFNLGHAATDANRPLRTRAFGARSDAHRRTARAAVPGADRNRDRRAAAEGGRSGASLRFDRLSGGARTRFALRFGGDWR